MRTLDAAETAAALPWGPLVEAMLRMFERERRGEARAAPRTAVPLAAGGTMLLMPAADAEFAALRLGLDLGMTLIDTARGAGLRYMHGERRVHISRWEYREAGNAYPVAVYAAGGGRDAIKPLATTSQQKAALARRRRNADPDKRDLFLSRVRALRRLQRPPVDPLVAVFFGMVAR